MTASIGDIPARIFMSYRREDTAYPAGWLFDRLAGHFGRDQVFKDIDSIELGDDFIEVITTAVGSCDVLLAVIGSRWLTITGPDGRRRLDDSGDFVRLEIEAALARDVRVIPILVDEARMPSADELPASLAKLPRRQALELSPARFDADIRRLLRVLDRTIAEGQERARQQAEQAAAARRRPAEPPAPDPQAREEAELRRRAADDGPAAFTLWEPLRDTDPAQISRLAHTLTGHTDQVSEVAFSPDGRLLASGSEDNTVRLWDPATGEHQRTLTGHTSAVFGVAFSPDGRLLASGSGDGTVRLWDPATGKLVSTLTHSNSSACYVLQVAFSPDGRLLASAGNHIGRTVELWDPATPKHVGTLDLRSPVAFSPDGRLLAGRQAGEERDVWLRDLAKGKLARRLTGHKGHLKAVAFSPDGRLLASGSTDGTARLWDPATGENPRTLTIDTRRRNVDRLVLSVAFSPDGRLLASAEYDGSVRLWDPATGEHLRTLKGPIDNILGIPSVKGVAFSPDGRLLASGGGDRTVRLWDLAAADR